MSAHTPGPWSVESPNGNVRASVAQPRSGEPLNTHIFMAALDSGASYDERIANARIAAAAPELLEALQAMHDQFGGTSIHPDDDEANALAKAAIAKATGESA